MPTLGVNCSRSRPRAGASLRLGDLRALFGTGFGGELDLAVGVLRALAGVVAPCQAARACAEGEYNGGAKVMPRTCKRAGGA